MVYEGPWVSLDRQADGNTNSGAGQGAEDANRGAAPRHHGRGEVSDAVREAQLTVEALSTAEQAAN